MESVLVMAQVSKTVMPTMVSNGQVFDQKLVVFATDSFSDQAVLSSSLHQLWAVKYSPTMRLDVSYSPKGALSTFPFPGSTHHLEGLGVKLNERRADILISRGLGLTKLYNLFNDPDVVGDEDVELMRALHVQVDEAVVAAYGWSDVELGHGFHTYRQVRRWTVSPAARVELMDRLLEENLRRAKEEQKLSVPAGRKGRGGQKAAAEVDGQHAQEGLF
ncbi:hypothetical protein MXD59_13370 [Frankia sp. Ag45/Mut15]|uniref:Uncharacterized protein n=2 Tax=Frankia umida TaxID=573489 RepID=A0ABT0JZ23_9ACTN|nr:hypothetical protein [Frankia umida]